MIRESMKPEELTRNALRGEANYTQLPAGETRSCYVPAKLGGTYCNDLGRMHKAHQNPKVPSSMFMTVAVANIRATQDSSQLPQKTECLRHDQEKAVQWANALALGQTKKFISDKSDVTRIAGGCSSLLVLGKVDPIFFKENRNYKKFVNKYSYGNERNVEEPDLFDISSSKLDKLALYLASERFTKLAAICNGDRDVQKAVLSAVNDDFGKMNIKYVINDIEELSELAAEKDEISRSWTLYRVGEAAKIVEGRPLTQRNVATYRLAVLMGISPLIAKSLTADVEITETCQTKKVENKYHGIIMNNARGINFTKFCEHSKEKGKWMNSPEFIRQLSILQIFDTICGQVDRHVDNYIIRANNHGTHISADGIQAIDNEMAFGLLLPKDLKHRVNKLPPFADNENQCTLPYIDYYFYKKVQKLDLGTLGYLFVDLLEVDEIKAMCERIEYVKIVLDKFVKEHPDRVVLTQDQKNKCQPKAKNSEKIKNMKVWENISDQYQKRGFVFRLYGHEFSYHHPCPALKKDSLIKTTCGVKSDR